METMRHLLLAAATTYIMRQEMIRASGGIKRKAKDKTMGEWKEKQTSVWHIKPTGCMQIKWLIPKSQPLPLQRAHSSLSTSDRISPPAKGSFLSLYRSSFPPCNGLLHWSLYRSSLSACQWLISKSLLQSNQSQAPDWFKSLDFIS